MRDHPHPGNRATRGVQPNYAGAIRGPAYGSCSPAWDLDGLSGRVGLTLPGVVDLPTSAREGISR